MLIEELIEKAFCEGYEYALEERFYSKEEEKEEKEKSKKKKISSGAAGLALIAGGSALNSVTGAKFVENLEKDPTEKSKQLYNKLKKNIKDRKVLIDDNVDMMNAGYSPDMKGMRDVLARTMKESRKRGYSKDLHETLNEINKGAKSVYGEKYKLGKKGFFIGKDLKGKADILAHEMGHEHYMDGKGKKSLGGVLHNSVVRNPLIGSVHGIAAGLHSGFKSEKQKYKGKKESKWNKYKSAIIPGIHAGFLVGSEAAASLHGYKKLKELGADKETLKDAKKNLSTALGTYAGLGAAQVGLGLASRSIGKKIGKAYYGIKKKLKNKEEGKENKRERD